MYMAGYSIECRLKAKLMRMFDCRHLRDLEHELRRRGALCADATVFSHELEILLHLTQGLDRLRQNEPIWRSFNMVNRWVPGETAPYLSNREDAEDFLEAIEKVAHWIDNNV